MSKENTFLTETQNGDCWETIREEYKARCKCCLDNLGSKSLWEEYYYNNEREVYGEMLMECFALRWEVTDEEHICESCIYRLRDAVKLKIEFVAVQELLLENVLSRNEMDLSIKEEHDRAIEEKSTLEQLESFKVERDDDDEVDEEIEISDTNHMKYNNLLEHERDGKDYEIAQEHLEILQQEDYEEEYLEDDMEPITKKYIRNAATKRRDVKRLGKCPKSRKLNKNKTYMLYTKADLENAKEAVWSEAMNPSQAAVAYGIPKKTLITKLQARDKDTVKDPLQEKHEKFIKEIETILTHTNAMPFRTKTTKYYCAYCTTDGQFFEDLEQLSEHTKSEHDIVGELDGIMRPQWLNEVLKIEITELKCTTCDIDIDHWNEMFVHFAEFHNLEFDESYARLIPFSLTSDLKCVLCKEKMSNYGQLDAHMNAHFCNYICYECGDTFLSASRLDRHLKVHKIGKYQCDLCDKVFTLEIYRTKHISLVHNQDNNVKCLYCPEKFLGTFQRHQHVVKEHPEKVKIISCDICGKTFMWKGSLRVHTMRAHVKEKKHKCSHCDKSYYLKYELRNHMLKHADKQSLFCGLCGLKFKKMSDFKKHWKGHEELNKSL